MAHIRAAQIVAFYLFDVAERTDLRAVPSLIGGAAVPARLAPRPATPAYVQYENPPLSFDGEALGIAEVEGFRTRVRLYDYGVVSVALVRSFEGDWSDLGMLAHGLIDDAGLEARAEGICRSVTTALKGAFTGLRSSFLAEDYLVFLVSELDKALTAEELLTEHGDDIAAILRGEREPLSSQERSRVLEHRLSYLATDLVVPAWNAAFVYDRPAAGQASLEILEFANSQLLEYRHYDQLLDAELTAIYARLQKPRWYDKWVGSRYANAARQVHALLIDVNELTDRTENALKFIGDIYAVRLFGLVADRLGLDKWKEEIESKLATLDDIYRFAVEQTAMSRGQFLELTVIVILVLELLLILMGVMK